MVQPKSTDPLTEGTCLCCCVSMGLLSPAKISGSTVVEKKSLSGTDCFIGGLALVTLCNECVILGKALPLLYVLLGLPKP